MTWLDGHVNSFNAQGRRDQLLSPITAINKVNQCCFQLLQWLVVETVETVRTLTWHLWFSFSGFILTIH